MQNNFVFKLAVMAFTLTITACSSSTAEQCQRDLSQRVQNSEISATTSELRKSIIDNYISQCEERFNKARNNEGKNFFDANNAYAIFLYFESLPSHTRKKQMLAFMKSWLAVGDNVAWETEGSAFGLSLDGLACWNVSAYWKCIPEEWSQNLTIFSLTGKENPVNLMVLANMVSGYATEDILLARDSTNDERVLASRFIVAFELRWNGSNMQPNNESYLNNQSCLRKYRGLAAWFYFYISPKITDLALTATEAPVPFLKISSMISSLWS